MEGRKIKNVSLKIKTAVLWTKMHTFEKQPKKFYTCLILETPLLIGETQSNFNVERHFF